MNEKLTIADIPDDVLILLAENFLNVDDLKCFFSVCKRFNSFAKDCVITQLNIDHIRKFPLMVRRVETLLYNNSNLLIDTAEILVELASIGKIMNLHIDVHYMVSFIMRVIACKQLKTLKIRSITCRLYCREDDKDRVYKAIFSHFMSITTSLTKMNLPEYMSNDAKLHLRIVKDINIVEPFIYITDTEYSKRFG